MVAVEAVVTVVLVVVMDPEFRSGFVLKIRSPWLTACCTHQYVTLTVVI